MKQSSSAQGPQDRRPSVLLVVVDDMGFSDCQPFGGEIATPHLQALADRGVSLGRFHTSSLCAPTRAMLLSGVDNHRNGLGVMPPLHATNQYGQPGYEGYLNLASPTLAELLRDAGYFTCMAGKWHLGKAHGVRPAQRGFERSFAFLGGGASHFNDVRPLCATELPATAYVEDDRDVTRDLPPSFYSSAAYTDYLIDNLRAHCGERPFFAYLAFTAPHDPLQVPDDWLERYKGQYDAGYDAIRRKRLQRMKNIGLIDERVAENPGSGEFSLWEAQSATQRTVQARKMEIYASMIENFDHHFGRVVDTLSELNRLDDTLIVFLSDNGANPKEPHAYPPNTEEQIAREFDNRIENMGRKGSFVSIGGAWAEVANTPLSYFKMTTYEGGTRTPLIVAGPGVRRRGVDAQQLLHVTDLLPTLLDFAGVPRPDGRAGNPTAPLYGRSLKPWLAGESQAPVRNDGDALGFEMIECKAIIKGSWKLVCMAPRDGELDDWKLYNLDQDPRELDDLAALHPEKLAEMVAEWHTYASAVGYVKAGPTLQITTMDAEAYFRFEQNRDLLMRQALTG